MSLFSFLESESICFDSDKFIMINYGKFHWFIQHLVFLDILMTLIEKNFGPIEMRTKEGKQVSQMMNFKEL